MGMRVAVVSDTVIVCIVYSGETPYLTLFISVGGADMLASTDTEGPSTHPYRGLTSNTLGSSISFLLDPPKPG